MNKELWVNPNPTTNMAAGTISLSDSIQNYRMLRVSFKIDVSGSIYTNELITVYNGSTQAIRVINLNSEGKLLLTRIVNASTGASLSIGGGYYTGGLNTGLGDYNGALVPVRVWGIK